MNTEIEFKLLEQAKRPDIPLSERRQAVRDLGAANDPALVPLLRALLTRQPPAIDEEFENWDPAGAERVVDLDIIRALHALGDDTEIGRLAPLIAQAHSTLAGPDDELSNATATVLAIGRVEPLPQIVALAAGTDVRAQRNATVVLERLGLPDAPTGQTVAPLTSRVPLLTFAISRLSEELDTIVSLSQGMVELSGEVKSWAAAHDYERGHVQRSAASLEGLLTRDIRLLGFTYSVTREKIIICTFAEAGARWRTWWAAHAGKIEFDRRQGRFVRRTP